MILADNEFHILLVEDDEVDIQSVQREFKKVNNFVNVCVAKNGIEALDMLYGRNGFEKIKPTPVLILLDLNIPELDGITFLKKLRADHDFDSVIVFLLTGAYSSHEKLAIHELNVAGCVVKPLTHADALHVFWAIVNERNAEPI